MLTVVFCDLVDSTGLGERMDPETVGEVLDLYFSSMTRVLGRHGGAIQKFIGDAIVAAFGIPELHEDDGLRAVRAAIEMGTALARLNVQLAAGYGVELRTRTGVHTGEVVIRQAVNDQQVLTGDTLNTAARLEQAAGPNEILIGQPTYRLVRGAVEVEAVPPLELKGKSEPVRAYRLKRAFGDEQSARRHLAPFVGRERELATLIGRFERARTERRCQLVTVIGEAGVGKSRLVRALIDAVRDDATILRGRCLSYGESITFWPLLTMVRDAAGITEGEAAEEKLGRLAGDPQVARRVASALGWSDEDLPVAELFWGVRSLFEHLARDRPLVVVFDDLHWASPTLLELIEHIVERSSDAPILVVGTARGQLVDARPTWSDGPAAERFVLDRLGDAASAQLISNMVGGLDMPDRTRSMIVEAAEGNPLFVEQLVSMLIDGGTLVQAGSAWKATRDLVRLEIPPSIHALLAARLDLLDADERHVIEPASVIGLEFASAAVREVSQPDARAAVDARLGSLAHRHLVREQQAAESDDDYRFDHLLIRDAAYAGILKRSRADLHERVADWLEGQPGRRERDEVVGYHLEQAADYRAQLGPLDPHARSLAARAADRLATAGRHAFVRGDLPAAIDLLQRARQLLSADDPARANLAPELAEALIEHGMFAEARTILDDAPAVVEGPVVRCAVARGRLVRLLADLYAGDAENWAERAEHEVAGAIATFEANDDAAGLATAWRIRFGAQQSALRYAAAARSAEAAMRNAEAAGDVRQRRRGASGYALAALLGPTPVAEALHRAEELYDLVEGDRATQAAISLSIAQLAAMDGQLERARLAYGAARTMLVELGSLVLAASTSIDAAPAEMLGGSLESAEAMLRRDDAELAGLGAGYLRSSVLGLLSRVLVRRGDLTAAEAVAVEVREMADPDDADAQVLWRSAMARCLAGRGLTDEAVALAAEAVSLTDGAEAPILRAEALADLGQVLVAVDPARARRCLSDALELHERKGNRVAAAELRALLGSTVLG